MSLLTRLRHKKDRAAQPATAEVPAVGDAEDRLELRWAVVDAAETAQYPDLMTQIHHREFDGITVTGVFTPEECAAAVGRMADVEWMDHFFGGLVGPPLGMYDADRSDYFAQSDVARGTYRELFGFDPHERLAQVIAPLAGGRPLVPPVEDGHEYNPGQLRRWKVRHGGLKAHVGNEFRRDKFDTAMNYLVDTTEVADHLSYFVVVQPPDEGGALSVYDVLWEDDAAETYEPVPLRDDSHFDDLPCLRVAPGAGDLVLFGGGWRWHRVDELTGSVERITYGGFCAPAADDSEIHFWA